ncbi:SDR family oxidoreductase [Amycolatopsis acidicola]|uniref:SDR family oxidoreductase n=1 Tax=Amycolatopsis acidicola TaxID=2596893 RepID=A0A5N0UYL7_9PSEU|nr:SDR family oxidoreductase [Amycolatopsis acidicola]KAA9156190.1 SDR family oxidoreductase [Amycolatopsis acidicola]
MTTVGVVTGAGRGMGLACAERMAGTVDELLLVDLDEAAAKEAAGQLGGRAYVLDITDADGLRGLAERVAGLGTLRAVAHAAGISPSMADWRRIFEVDFVATARLAETLRPLATAGTAMVCFASMAPLLDPTVPPPGALAALDEPLDPGLTGRLREALGESIEDTGTAYSWAKRGVHRFVRQEAVRLGPAGARICSVSPGIIDTPQGRQEAGEHPSMAALVERTPLARRGQAAEVAAVVAFALSAEASFVNGIDIPVDGGVLAALGAAR